MIRDSRFIRELTARRAGYRAAMYRIAHEWADLPLYAEPIQGVYVPRYEPVTDAIVYEFRGPDPGSVIVGYSTLQDLYAKSNEVRVGLSHVITEDELLAALASGPITIQ